MHNTRMISMYGLAIGGDPTKIINIPIGDTAMIPFLINREEFEEFANNPAVTLPEGTEVIEVLVLVGTAEPSQLN